MYVGKWCNEFQYMLTRKTEVLSNNSSFMDDLNTG